VVLLLLWVAAEARVLEPLEQVVVLEAVDILLLLVLQELELLVREITEFKETIMPEQTAAAAEALGALERVPVY
jgi:hypothetical protein